MGRRDMWNLMCVLSCSLLVVSATSPVHFVILPNVLRLETEEVVSVTTLESEQDVQYKIYLQDFPSRNNSFLETYIRVSPGEVGMGKIKLSAQELRNKSMIVTTPSFVYLVVETVAHSPFFQQEAKLLVHDSPGYIFIQTDKPIYTPDQAVYLRVMRLNENLRPVNWPIQVDIQNSDGMVVSRKVLESNNMFLTDVIKIPENPVFGNWTATAKYLNGLKTSGAIRFEVAEYVLPTFAVKFHIPEEMKVVQPNDYFLNLTVQAMYTYGKPVKGHATVTFGLFWHGHVFSLGKRRNLKLNETGHTECRISKDEFQHPVQTVWFPNGGKLNLQASVTEDASGRTERAEDSSVVFSEFLYIVKYTGSSKHFKPGLPYMLEVDVLKANGEPGALVSLNVECTTDGGKLLAPLTSHKDFVTNSRGKITVPFSVPPHAKTLLFKVAAHTASADSDFRVEPFFSPTSVYLHLSLDTRSQNADGERMPMVGDSVTVTTQYTRAQSIHTVNLVVLARGRVVWQVSTRNIQGHQTSFHFRLTPDMSPRAQVLAFSVLENKLGSEVISDTAWLDVLPECDGEISLKLEDDLKTVFRPGDVGTVSLSGPPNTMVALVAVDSAVFLIRNHTLTKQSIFQSIKDHDRTCGFVAAGDTNTIFKNAGLTVLTNAGLQMDTKLVEGCRDKAVKKKRSTGSHMDLPEVCCREGSQLQHASLAMCYDISRLLQKMHKLQSCAKAFYDCCRDAVKGNNSFNVTGRMQSLSGDQESELNLDEDFFDTVTLPVRTNFPESWWFEEYNLGPEGRADVDFVLPDSITSWSVQAIGMSKEAGLCVAPALTLTTFSSFFLQLDLPYSVVRLEQLEVRATVYNYMNRRLRVHVVLQSTEGICYSGQPGHKTEAVRLEVPAHDAASAYFPIVPLEIGAFPIKVMAVSTWGRDAVEKTLRVEGEGLEKIHTVSVMLDPSGRRFNRNKSSNQSFSVRNEVKAQENRQSVELDLDLPAEVIPDTESCTIHAMGDLLGPTLKVIIEGVAELLRMPTGCGEQNLIYLAPNVYVTRYLRATRQLSSTIEKKATILIRQGVARQMTFRKPDASYATWPHAESSTWLTAFAMKTLCQAEHYVSLDHNQTCDSLHWVAGQQNLDGSFKEEIWVTHREMLGGVNGDVSHTAYILAALLECDCPDQKQESIEKKAMNYIEANINNTDRPLAVALSAYALTLAGSPWSQVLVKRLLSMAKSSPEGFSYWTPGTDSEFGVHEKPYWYVKKPGALAVELTSYVLLTLLAQGDVTSSTNIVGWLLQQRNSHGAFISTQDTVVGLQALSEYSMKSYSTILDMTCHIRSDVDHRFRKSISLTPRDALVLKSVPKVPTGGKLHFEAEGTGVGVMQVEVRFNVPEDETECQFEVTVTSHQHSSLLQTFFWDGKRSRCEPCSLDCEEEDLDGDSEDSEDEDWHTFTLPAIVPRIQTLWWEISRSRNYSRRPDLHDNSTRTGVDHTLLGTRIGRPKRSIKGYSLPVICLEVCVRYLGESSTGMAVIDVGLFTGFEPLEEDLEVLKLRGKIDHYEKSQRSVVFYLDKISNQESLCLKFRAKRVHTADNLQPAKVQVFDYYNPDERCTVFYKANNSSGQLVNFCDSQKQICQCLESRCAHCEESWQGLTWLDMIKFACRNATHVMEVKALDRDLEKAGFERILGHVVSVGVQRGRQEVKEGDKVILLKRSSCLCPRISEGHTYLMMLSDPKRFKDSHGNHVFAFLLDKKVIVIDLAKQKGLSRAKKDLAKTVRRTLNRLERKECSDVTRQNIIRRRRTHAQLGKHLNEKKT